MRNTGPHFPTASPTTASGESQWSGIPGIDSPGITREAFYFSPLNTRGPRSPRPSHIQPWELESVTPRPPEDHPRGPTHLLRQQHRTWSAGEQSKSHLLTKTGLPRHWQPAVCTYRQAPTSAAPPAGGTQALSPGFSRWPVRWMLAASHLPVERRGEERRPGPGSELACQEGQGSNPIRLTKQP